MERKKIRYGVIGIKGVGERHCVYAGQNTRAELAAVVDIDSDFVAKKSAELGIPGFTDYRDLLERGIVDAVSIATPHDHHFAIAKDCLDAGVHTYIEKPISTNLSEAEKIVALAKARKLRICVGHQYRLFRSSQIIKRLIDSGDLGKIRRVLWTWGVFRPHSYYVRWPWKGRFRQAGSGVLGYHAIHDLDLICWIIGKPVQVSAFIGNQYHEAETEDFACASILFENGAFGSLQFSITHPNGYSVRQIAGDKGILVMPDVKSLTDEQDDEILLGTYQDNLSNIMTQLAGEFDQPGVSWQSLKRSADTCVAEQRSPAPEDNPFFKRLLSRKHAWRFGRGSKESNIHSAEPWVDPICNLVTEFIDAILEDRDPIVNGESTLPAIELMNALLVSAARKKTVNLPVDPGECDQLFKELSTGKTQAPRFR
jgi:UDP-N-acetyl-2-amino-2-deoxyglucuronate dehydrogenase